MPGQRPFRRLVLLLAAATLCVPLRATAATRHVPEEFATIQAAIDASASGDEILVSSGIYYENVDTHQKVLTLVGSGAASTTIDGSSAGSVVRFTGGGRLEGFTIRNGLAREGGGIYLSVIAATVVTANTIVSNTAFWGLDNGLGGGVFIAQNAPSVVISNNVISSNYAGESGAGIYLGLDQPRHVEVAYNTISGNSCHASGAGLFLFGGVTHHNLIAFNRSDGFAGGIQLAGGAVLSNTIVYNTIGSIFSAGAGVQMGQQELSNNIVAYNHGPGARGYGVRCSTTGGEIVTCNDVYGNAGGNLVYNGTPSASSINNFAIDPLFCDLSTGDYHLAAESPCAPTAASGCDLIGAYPINPACSVTPTKRVSWGHLKQQYR